MLMEHLCLISSLLKTVVERMHWPGNQTSVNRVYSTLKVTLRSILVHHVFSPDTVLHTLVASKGTSIPQGRARSITLEIRLRRQEGFSKSRTVAEKTYRGVALRSTNDQRSSLIEISRSAGIGTRQRDSDGDRCRKKNKKADGDSHDGKHTSGRRQVPGQCIRRDPSFGWHSPTPAIIASN